VDQRARGLARFARSIRFVLPTFSIWAALSSPASPATFNPAPATPDSDPGSLREAIGLANSNADLENTVLLQAGTYALTAPNSAGQDNLNIGGDLDLTTNGKTYVIEGQGTAATIIDGLRLDRAFHLHTGVTVHLRNLTIRQGWARDDGTPGSTPGSTPSVGGGALIEGGTLECENVLFELNSALGYPGATGNLPGQPAMGGAIAAFDSTVVISGASMFRFNGAAGGGGSPQSINFSGLPGGPGGFGAGGAIWASGGTLHLSSTTFLRNGAGGGRGGAGYNLFPPGTSGGAAGSSRGGAIWLHSGGIEFVGVTFSENSAEAGEGGSSGDSGGGQGPAGAPAEGGAIWLGGSTGSMDEISCANNHVLGGRAGSSGRALPFGSLYPGRTGGAASGGCAHIEDSSLTLEDSILQSNSTGGGAGGQGGDGNVGAASSNGGPGAEAKGGALSLLRGSTALRRNSFFSNTARGGGGGSSGAGLGGQGGPGGEGAGGCIAFTDSVGALEASTLAFNVARGGVGGGAGFGGNSGNEGGRGTGGAIWTSAASVLLINSTVSSNSALGGEGGLALAAPSIPAGDGGDGGTATAGGVFAESDGLTLNNCTIALNQSSGGGPGGAEGGDPPGAPGAAGSADCGGIEGGGVIEGSSTIVAGNSSPGSQDACGELEFDHSLLQSSAGATLSGVDNLVGVDPQLGLLANNGGPTRTHSITFASPAYNHGANPSGAEDDQRGVGFARVRGGIADIGAYEAFPELPGVFITVSPSATPEGAAALAYLFTREDSFESPLSESLTVAFSVGGSASAFLDYSVSGADLFDSSLGTFTFAAGAPSGGILLTPLEDLEIEGIETADLSLSASTDYAVADPASASGSIVDVAPALVEIPTSSEAGLGALGLLLALSGLILLRQRC